MPSLYKKKYLVSNPKTGKKVGRKSKKWWGRYRDALGKDERVPLVRDKAAAQTMLTELAQKAEREAAGLLDPFEKHTKRPLVEHIKEFKQHLQDKGNDDRYVAEVATKVLKIVNGCRWTFIRDLSPSDVYRFLADLRSNGRSIGTSNHYLRAIKQFSRWLVRDRRNNDDPLVHLQEMNSKTDRRHDRRALGADEFARLIEAAQAGPPIQTIPGRDRTVLYILAAWTGFRKRELGSLTLRSLNFDSDPPTATVQAAYSKRRQKDTQVLHPEVVRILNEWIATKPDLGPDELLFPVSGRVPDGTERKTAKMMRLDLESARRKWIEEAVSDDERVERENSDFLAYCDESGEFADFHSNRHTFITSLEHVGVSPRTAQELARHADLGTTMRIYTHIGLHDKQAAIESLPAPPVKPANTEHDVEELRATGTDDAEMASPVVPTLVPKGAKNGAIQLASKGDASAPNCTDDGEENGENKKKAVDVTVQRDSKLGIDPHQDASACITMSNGASSSTPGRIRTCDLRIRNPVLYPTELRVQLVETPIYQFVAAIRQGRGEGQRISAVANGTHLKSFPMLGPAGRHILSGDVCLIDTSRTPKVR